MIAFARAIDGDLRAVRKDYEENVGAVDANTRPDRPGDVRDDGTSSYPDATFTLRLSYGTVGAITTTVARSRRSPPSAAPSSARPAPIRSSCPTAGSRRRPRSTRSSRSISSPPTTSSAATPARRWSTGRRGRRPHLRRQHHSRSAATSASIRNTNRAIAVAVGALRMALARIYHADRLVEELGR